MISSELGIDRIDHFLWADHTSDYKRAMSSKLDAQTTDLYLSYSSANTIENCDIQAEEIVSNQPTSSTAYLVDNIDTLKLSIVVTTRNDTHVEQMQERTEAFLNNIEYLSNKYQVNTELIIVEWNPPEDRPPVSEAYKFPANNQFLTIRIVTVTNDIHWSYDFSKNFPLFQMIGKNVGIRRSRGKFVLATNIDVLLSEKLFRYITNNDLSKNTLYRSDRWDIDRDILNSPDPERQLSRAPGMVLTINSCKHSTNPQQPQASNVKYNITKESHHYPNLHYMACGDFQMLHRDDWLTLRGYYELDAYSVHLDSVFAISCFHAGLAETIIPYEHYHIDHSTGDWSKKTFVSNKGKELKHISMESLAALNSLQNHIGYLNLNDNWGLGGTDLPEQILSQADWDSGVAYKDTYSDSQLNALVGIDYINNILDLTSLRERYSNILQHISCYITAKQEDRQLYIWGTGQKSQSTQLVLQKQNHSVSGFIHGGTEKSEISGALTPSEILPMKNKVFIIIASMFDAEIREYLDKHQFVEGVDYINYM